MAIKDAVVVDGLVGGGERHYGNKQKILNILDSKKIPRERYIRHKMEGTRSR